MLEKKIKQLNGPILIFGASGFVGANLYRMIKRYRDDVFGTASFAPCWRLEDIPNYLDTVKICDLRNDVHLKEILNSLKPQTIFNCLAYGAYAFEAESDRIFQTNFILTTKILAILENQGFKAYIHAGSSSEYGDMSAGPSEKENQTLPNSDYSVSKLACAQYLKFIGRKKALPVANLRLYSVYGPFEDSARLIPNLVGSCLKGQLPSFVNKDISRDFIFVDDAVDAFITCAINIKPDWYGESFNIGTGQKTSIENLAKVASDLFGIQTQPEFGTLPPNSWDLIDWFSNPTYAFEAFQWKAKINLDEGLKKTSAWLKAIPDWDKYKKDSKKNSLDKIHSISAIIACYKDNLAIPIMYERLSNVFSELEIDYEIIFINDNSPDDSEDMIKKISERDQRVIGITHSRNFGSQAAFKSGMLIASKNSCVLMDGDLQDPPELIPKFLEQWKNGFDIVYGVRVKRDAPLYMQFLYKLFYRIFDYFSYIKIPHDAGDFSLIDRKVVNWILSFPEKDFFIRGIRAYVGFKQTGIDYHRPERMFGKSTNNFKKNISWAKKAILSYSYTPLSAMSSIGFLLFFLSIILILLQLSLKFFNAGQTPKGLTTIILITVFFGSINLLGISVLGEYLAKIFEEVKSRPSFIRNKLIQNGKSTSIENVNK